MRNLYRYVISILFLCLVGELQAQIATVKAGFNLADVREPDLSFVPKYNMKSGYHVGVAVEFPFNSNLSIEPALLYSNKGAKINGTFSDIDVQGTVNLHYLDVPVNLKLSNQLQGGSRIFVTAGPYLGIGLAGKIQSSAQIHGETGTIVDLEWGSDSMDYYNKLELGTTFGAGMEIKMLQFGISYDLGLTNISAHKSDYESAKNRVLKFSVGYRFGKK